MKAWIVLLLSSSLVQAAGPQPQPKMPADDQFDATLYSWSRTLAESFQIVKTKYYIKDLNPKDAILKAIGAFVGNDPHSALLAPSEHKEILESTSGEFFGIGVAIAEKAPEEEFLAIMNTVLDGPAEKAGVKGGDKLIEIDGAALRGLSTAEATAKLKGPRNSVVNIKVMRDGVTESLPFAIKRDVVKEQSTLSFYFKEHGIYYVHLNTFSNNAVTALEGLIKKAYKQKSKGLILDLRNNSGGLLTAAVDMASLFLDKGSLVVSTKDRDNKQLEEWRTTREPISSAAMPIIILINNFSASAAEILAGALKIHSQQMAQKNGSKQQRIPIILVGTKTFGKGSVQEVIPISNDCALKLTTALYFLPNDETIQGVGIEPDLLLERKFPPPNHMQWVSQVYGRESALRNSIKVKGSEAKVDKETKDKKNTKKNDKEWRVKRKEAIESDSQIRDAITCLNILNGMPQAWHNRADAISLLKRTLALDDNMKSEEIN
jgi:carboxyl-terminal processing protease